MTSTPPASPTPARWRAKAAILAPPPLPPSVTASRPCKPWVYCPKPGQIIGWLFPNPTNTLGYVQTVTGTVSATDLATGSVVSEPVTWMGLC